MDPAEFVIDKNGLRRHLTAEQRVAIIYKLRGLPEYGGQNKTPTHDDNTESDSQSLPIAPPTVAEAAAAAGTSYSTASNVSAEVRKNPESIDRIASGESVRSIREARGEKKPARKKATDNAAKKREPVTRMDRLIAGQAKSKDEHESLKAKHRTDTKALRAKHTATLADLKQKRAARRRRSTPPRSLKLEADKKALRAEARCQGHQAARRHESLTDEAHRQGHRIEGD